MQGSGFRVQGPGFGVKGFGCRGWSVGLGVQAPLPDRYSSQFENNYFTEMCSGSEAGSYSRHIDFFYHPTLGLRVIMKKKRHRCPAATSSARLLRQPAPYTPHPTPYTLHPTLYTLHPTPYTLGTAPRPPRPRLATPLLRQPAPPLSRKGNSNPHGARPVYLIITMIKDS